MAGNSGNDNEQPSTSKQALALDETLAGYYTESFFDAVQLASTSRVSPKPRPVDWDRLNQSWSGYSSSGSSRRVPTNRPVPINRPIAINRTAPIPKAYSSKKGKGVGKGRRKIEPTPSTSGCSSSSSLSPKPSTSTYIPKPSKDSTEFLPSSSEDVSTAMASASISRCEATMTEFDPSSFVEEDKNSIKLEIIEPFDDTVVRVGQPVTLTCRVEGIVEEVTWFRNGEKITFDDRVKVIEDPKMQDYSLKIDETERRDDGVYTFEARGRRDEYRTYRGKLFIGEDTKTPTSIRTGYSPRYSLDPVKSLKHISVRVGEGFQLSATFKHPKTTEFRWFANQRPIKTDGRCVVTSTDTIATLTVKESMFLDIGIYMVVAKTQYGITSSWTDVHIVEHNYGDVRYRDCLPYIEEVPINAVAHVGEEVRIYCRVRGRDRAELNWCRSARRLKLGDRVQAKDYGDSYFGLRFKSVSLDDADEYSIRMNDKVTKESTSEACNISVLTDTSDEIDVKVLKPLLSAIVTYGSPLTLDCRFDVSDCENYFACWYIGHDKVIYTDSRFRMACKNGIFLINILKMEPGMNGEAMCELRTPLSNGNSVVRAVTTCNLAIVPLSVLKQELSLEVIDSPCQIMSEKYSLWSSRGLILTSPTRDIKRGFHIEQQRLPANQTLFYIEFCRLEDDFYYYLNVTDIFDEDKSIIMSIQELNRVPNVCGVIQPRKVNIGWEYQGSKYHGNKEIWYCVDYRMSDGFYMPIGITSEPHLVYDNPAINVSAHFRISTIIPDSYAKSADISIQPTNSDTEVLPEDFIPQPIYKFNKRYKNLAGTIGNGAYGSVGVVRHRSTNKTYAVKSIKFKSFEHKETCNRELNLLKSIRHPKIVRMVDAYRSDNEAKLVMECLWGRELFERIANSYHVVESDVIPYVRQICEALNYLHQRNIVHLDIKPENIICVHPNSRQIKIVDFGLARRLNPAYRTMVLHGTRNYVSPEILNYDQLTVKSDMWSLGVVTYMLLSGLPPFGASTWNEESVKIIRAEYSYDDRAFRDISDLAKNFIDQLLVVDVSKRLGAQQALQHQWLLEGPPEKPLKNLKCVTKTKSRWQKARIAMIAAQRFRRLI